MGAALDDRRDARRHLRDRHLRGRPVDRHPLPHRPPPRRGFGECDVEELAEVRDAVALQIQQELRALPGIAWVEPKAALGGHCEARTGTARAICLGIDVERSGDLIWMPAEHWITQDLDEPVATGHGSIYPYDRRVPLILLAPGRTVHAQATEPGETRSMTEVAPLLARWLRVTAPLDLR